VTDIVDKEPWPTWEDEIRGLVNEIKWQKDEIGRLRMALREIEWSNDSKWQSDRARAALEGEKKDIMRTLVDKINQQAIAIAERDEFIEIMGMCNEFEEFLSK
jgi:hypothetical protein